MLKFIFANILFLVSSVSLASANWIIVSETNEIEFSIDSKSIQKNGDSITFWTRRNYAQRTKDGILSTKDQITINCRTRDRTFRYMQTFDGNNNSGKIIDTFQTDSKWEPIPPETIMWTYFEFVCKR